MPQSSSPGFTLRPEILSSVGHRFYIRIQHKFRLRLVEWAGACQLLLLGWILAQPDPTFSNGPGFLALADLMGEESWAFWFLFVGATRLIALFINGSMESVTPWFRAFGAIFGFMSFAVITYSLLAAKFILGTPVSTGLAMYSVAATCEVAAIYLAFADARIYQNGRRSRSNP